MYEVYIDIYIYKQITQYICDIKFGGVVDNEEEDVIRREMSKTP